MDATQQPHIPTAICAVGVMLVILLGYHLIHRH